MKIRVAIENDLTRIVEMSARFYPHTSYFLYSGFPFSAAGAGLVAKTLIETKMMLVCENDEGEVVGMVGAMLLPFLFNPDYFRAGEIIWWVEPEYWSHGYGGALLKAMKELCKEAKVQDLTMISLVNSHLNADKLLESEGFIMTEKVYTLRIE